MYTYSDYTHSAIQIIAEQEYVRFGLICLCCVLWSSVMYEITHARNRQTAHR